MSMKIGLIGLGCVGHGFLDIYRKSGQDEFEIRKICVRNPDKKRDVSPEILTFDPADILTDGEIEVVIEAISDAGAALEIARKALSRGKHLISANKKMIAENLPELVGLAQKNSRIFLYEASSCASVPAVRVLDSFFAHDSISHLAGIFNGSSNYILSKMAKERLSYDEALEEAQQKGFAEADPTLDVDGWDATSKLSILTYHAYSLWVHPQDIFRTGISSVTSQLLTALSELNFKVKPLAMAIAHEDQISLTVAPYLIDRQSPLFDVEYEFNGVEIDSAYSGRQLLTGKGAGAFPTGTAIWSDLMYIVNHRNGYNWPTRSKKTYQPASDLDLIVYSETDLSRLAPTLGKPSSSEGKFSHFQLNSTRLDSIEDTLSQLGVSYVFSAPETVERLFIHLLNRLNLK